jgi:hypothetical protein
MLNLMGKSVTTSVLLPLFELKKLRAIYLFQTKVNANGWNRLTKALPKIIFDTGGYFIPFLPTDAMVVRTAGQGKQNKMSVGGY